MSLCLASCPARLGKRGDEIESRHVFLPQLLFAAPQWNLKELRDVHDLQWSVKELRGVYDLRQMTHHFGIGTSPPNTRVISALICSMAE